MIITLCGPYRFSKEMWDKYKELTAEGHLVFLPAFDAKMEKIDKVHLHREKIKMSDAIYVVNVNGYFGEDTDSEIWFAEMHEKKILWLEPPPSQD